MVTVWRNVPALVNTGAVPVLGLELRMFRGLWTLMVDPARLLKAAPFVMYRYPVPFQTPDPGPDWLTVPERVLVAVPPRLNDPWSAKVPARVPPVQLTAAPAAVVSTGRLPPVMVVVAPVRFI